MLSESDKGNSKEIKTQPAHQDYTRRKPLNNDPEPGIRDVLEQEEQNDEATRGESLNYRD